MLSDYIKILRSLWDGIAYIWEQLWASLVAQMVKNLTAMQETQVRSLGWEDPWRREWLPTPVFLPGELQMKQYIKQLFHINNEQLRQCFRREIKPYICHHILLGIFADLLHRVLMSHRNGQSRNCSSPHSTEETKNHQGSQ